MSRHEALKIEVIDDTALIDISDFVGKRHQKTMGRKRGKPEELNSMGGISGMEDGKKKRVYSRREMECLRYVNVEEQQEKWNEVYNGLAPSVAKEYDDMLLIVPLFGRNRDNPSQNFTRRSPGPPFLGEECGLSGSDVVDEAGGRDEESDEEVSSIQRPAFLVTGVPDFDSGPPQDGLEYLRRVRWEAERIPKVKIAKVEINKLNKEQTVYMPKIPDIAKCSHHLMPLKQWEDSFLAYFSELRLTFSRHDAVVHPEKHFHGMLEKIENLTMDSSSTEIEIENVDSSSSLPSATSFVNRPTLSTILGMDSVARISMLRKRINSAESVRSLSRDDCEWLFALCVALDTPLNADTCASLRCLLRKCASLRADKSEPDDEVVMLNVLITISGKYFGQSES